MLIDIHTHTAFARPAGVTRANGSAYPTPERLIAMMDAHGIDRAVVLCTLSPECRLLPATADRKRISDKAYEKITWRNANRLFDLGL